MSSHPYFDGPRPRVLAHRGLVAEGDVFAENTVAAFAAAVSAGVVYLESDCHLSADGEVILFHDDDLTRVTGDSRRVSDVTLRELDRIMEDRGGLLTLRDALDGFPDARWNLDVKAASAADPVGRLVAKHGARVLVTSFSDDRRRAALAAARETGADPMPAASAGTGTIARTLLAVGSGSAALVGRALADVDALQIPERQGILPVLSSRLIRLAHAADREVHVWTVNDVEHMRQLVAMGVDGIVTDRADAALEALA